MRPSATMTQSQLNLHIIQQNCKHCLNIAHTLINTLDPNTWDLVLLQEPYVYPNSNLTVALQNWIMIYPTPVPDDPSTLKAIILVSNRLKLDSYQQVPVASNHIAAIHINVQSMSILIFNVYNPPKSNLAIDELRCWLARQQPSDHMIWAGDFNKHDTLWLGPTGASSHA